MTPEKLAYVKKFLVALAAAVGVAIAALADGAISVEEGVSIAVAFAGSLGVYKAENGPKPA